MNVRHQRSSYRLLGLVGNGQFGRVYCGIHRRTGQLVAIKYLHRHSLSTHAFLQELHCLLSLSHTNIVTCHAVEHSEDGRRLVLEYCAGGTLRSHMLTPLSLTEIFNLITDVLQGLAHAHQQGIVHCDVKPENILLSYCDGRWRARISDFGIAKLVQDQPNQSGSGQTGSPAYMAPERFYRQYSPAADVYAVGVMLFELIVGRRPFTGTPTALQLAHLNQPVPEAEQLSDPIKKIVAKALEKLPARRYPTATEMLADWRRLEPLDLEVTRPRHVELTDYSPYTGSALYRLTQPVNSLQELLSNATITPQTLIAYGPQIAVLQQNSLTISEQILDSPIQEIYPSKTGLFVATKYALWNGANYGSLTLFNQWQTPVKVAVDPRHRWAAWADFANQQLTIAPLSKSETAVCPIRCPLAPDIDISQILALDGGHIGVLSNSEQMGSRLLLWNRRGMYLTSLNLGITLQQLTPMGKPHQWLAIDVKAPQTVIYLMLKPLRMTRIPMDICPKFMFDLPWGYLFCDIKGRMVLLDRDWYPIGGIQGPEGITALTSVSNHEVLVATWNDNQIDARAIHRMNLQDYDLDMIF